MVEEHIRHTIDFQMARHGYNGNRHGVLKPRVDRNESLHPQPDQHLRVIFDQVPLVSVMRRKVKIPCLNQPIADRAHHLGVITGAQLRHQDPDRQSPPAPQ